ncbi:MAG: N-acetyl-gamma-glutamyl-phosphate reductase [Myxococcaceae bacterium]
MHIALFGASGYSGLVAGRLLSAHPRAKLAVVTSDKWGGSSVLSKTGDDVPLKYVSHDEGLALAKGCAAALLATPAEASLTLAPKLLELGCKVVDLSGAFRLKQEDRYPAFYNFTHSAPALLAKAVYGMPELGRQTLGALVANPGCYATAAALQLAPLLKAGVIEKTGIVIDAASGTTGAGRTGSEDYGFGEIDEDFRAYKVLKHQHTPEILQTLAVPSLTFTPHLLPLRRGILSTAYARLAPGKTAAQVRESLARAYEGERFIRVLADADQVNLKAVVGTNRCDLGVSVDETGLDPGRVVVVSAIDNLLKGAAGQAVQNLNLLMGWPEHEGLTHLRAFHP